MHLEFAELVVVGATFVVALGLAAHYAQLSAPTGFILAGIFLSPILREFSDYRAEARILIEIGSMLFMLGLGLRAPLCWGWPRSRTTILRAGAHVTSATAFGLLFAASLGWPILDGVFFGLCLAPASFLIVFSLRDNMSASAAGREASEVALCTALIAMVVVVVLSAGRRAWPALALDKGALIAVMSLAIARFVLLLAAIAHLIIRATRRPSGRSFSLDTPQLIALGLGLASAGALVFGVPPAVAAFLTGMALGYVTIVRQASKNLRPMLDLLAVAFFVALGLQFDPGAVRSAPLAFLATLLFVSVGKPWLAMAVGTRIPLSLYSRLAVARSLGQIGECHGSLQQSLRRPALSRTKREA